MDKEVDFLLIGAQEPMEVRLKCNSNIFPGIPPYFTPYGKDFLKMASRAQSLPAYALPMLAASIKQKKYSVSCINDFCQESPERLRRAARCTRYAVGISTTFLTNKDSIIKIAKFLRKANPSLKIMMGGPGIINSPDVRSYSDVNIFYEGEKTMEELASLLSKGADISSVKSISYFRRGREILTEKRECIKDLGEIPVPDWSSLGDTLDEERYLPIESSRGCIGRCSFCLERQYWPGVRFYPIERVVKELKNNISKFGIKFYYFQDSNMCNKRAYLASLCDAFRKEGLKIIWSCETRIDTISRELVERMYSAGCRAITFGMESADPDVLRNMNKSLSDKLLKEFSSIVKHMRERGMIANINIIVGFPGENERSIKNTTDFLLEARPIAYSMSKFFLERGTDIWKDRANFNLRGSMLRWRSNSMNSGQLDGILRRIFLTASKDPGISHWPSASVDLIRHMSRGKSLQAFIKYIQAVNQMCAEDLTRKENRYSREYDRSFNYITSYL